MEGFFFLISSDLVFLYSIGVAPVSFLNTLIICDEEEKFKRSEIWSTVRLSGSKSSSFICVTVLMSTHSMTVCSDFSLTTTLR